jgi:hypothetical protein
VKRRSLRASARGPAMYVVGVSHGIALTPGIVRAGSSKGVPKRRMTCRLLLDRRGRRYDLEASWSF